MAPLSKGRLADLILSDIDRRSMWPALLTAPVLLYLMASVIGVVFSGVVALGSDGPFRFQILLYPITAIVSAAAACAFTAFCTAPKGDWLRVVLLLFLTPPVAGIPVAIMFMLLLSKFPTLSNQNSSFVLLGLIPTAVSLTINGALYYFSLRGLQSERMWNRLRAGAELT